MRRKLLPAPPADLTTVRAAHAAVPLVPGTEEDCCARLQGRLELPGRDTAATWLDFLRGLGLAEAGQRGFARVRTDPDDDELAATFLESVLGAREAVSALEAADEPLDAAAIADGTVELVTPWERRRHGSEWRAVWTARTNDLLGWLVLFGLAERADAGYRVNRTD